MKQFLILVACALVGTASLSAQCHIYGTVLNASNNEPLVNAHILFKGSISGTSSGENGSYSLYVPDMMLGDVTIVVSFVGFKTVEMQQYTSANQSYKLNFSLTPGFDELREVTVSAQKQAENNRVVPLSVSSLSSTDVKERSANSLFDLSGQIPSTYMETNSPAYSSVQIRGVSNLAASIGGVESNIAAYVDEAYLPRPILFNLPFLDIERVEIVRGPQGTLFGKNTIGGIYNFTSARPVAGIHGGAELSYGAYNLMQARGYFNFEPVKDKLFIRFAGIFRKRDGYIKNETAPDLMAEQYGAGKFQILFRPFEKTSIHLIAELGRYDGTGYAFDSQRGVLNDSILDGFDYRVSNNPVNNDYLINRSIQLNLAQDIGSWTLHSISAFRSSEYFVRTDRDISTDKIIEYERDENISFFSQEVRVESDTANALHFLAGLYFDHQLHNGYDSLVLGTDADRILGVEIPGFREWLNAPYDIQSNSYAAFANFRYRLGNRWNFRVGLRYSYDWKSMTYQQELSPNALLLTISVRNLALRNDLSERGAISTDASVSYNIMPDAMVYGRFARGYKAGGFSTNPITLSNPDTLTLKPEFLNTYELGFKSSWFKNRLNFNLALYYMQYLDKQEAVRVNSQFVVQSADISSKGIELEAAAVPVKGLVIGGTASYNDARYGTFIAQTISQNGDTSSVDYSNNVPPLTPTWIASLYAQYSYDISEKFGFFLRGDYLYRSSAYLQLTGDEDYVQPSNIRLNARIGVKFLKDRFSLSFWMRNITGTNYMINSYELLSSSAIAPTEPRMWGIEARATF